MTLSSTTHLRTFSSEGISYITSSQDLLDGGAESARAGLALFGLAWRSHRGLPA